MSESGITSDSHGLSDRPPTPTTSMETDEATIVESAAKIKNVQERIDKVLGGRNKSNPPAPK